VIRIARGDEPHELKAERRRRLARAVIARGRGADVEFIGYDVAKEKLVEALNYKCAFCEINVRREGSPIEHFRPKAHVSDGVEARDRAGYWWLAWTWSNLLLACARCNTSYKRNKFPLAVGAEPLPEYSEALDQENALLIDPASVDPTEHIAFRKDPTVNRWVAVPLRRSAHAYATITTLGLDQDDQLNVHVDDRVRPWVDALERDIEAGDATKVRETWARMCASLFAPRQPFHALTRDALASFVSEADRKTFVLVLPTLGREEPVRRFAVFDDPPEYSGIDERLRVMCRALGDRSEWKETRELLKELLLAKAEWTDAELAVFLERSQETIRQYRERLAGEASATANPSA
jgi:uncharacterized protein (TIGR02646 family)